MRLVSALLDYFGRFFRRIIISLRFPSILLVIALILTVLIPGISLEKRFRAMRVTMFSIVLLESKSYDSYMNVCIRRALAFVLENRERFGVRSSFYHALSPLLVVPNPLFLFFGFFFFYFLLFFFLFFFSFLLSFIFFLFSSFSISISNVNSTLNPRFRISLTLDYFQLSNFITNSGNVILSSNFQLTGPSLISNIQTWLGTFQDGPQAPIWSELPADIIGAIINRIHNSKDIQPILTFCNPCSSACVETTTCSLFPWLMLSNKLDSDLQCFFNLCNNKYLWLEIPTSDQKRCWGSPHGLVVTLGPDYEAYLVDVRKEEQIALPPLNPIRALAQLEEWFRPVHKFIILKDPSHELLFLVFAIFGPVNRLAFARVAFNRGGDAAALNRRGQGQWAIVTNPRNLKFNDVACFNDKIYALCDNGELVCLTLDAPLAAEVQDIAPQRSEEEIGTPQKLYLMNSQQNIIAVFRYGFHTPSKMRHETISFLVYKFNFSTLDWEETDLEDCTAFVGEGNSWCMPTSTIPCRSNRIYFTDDSWELQMYPGVAYGGCDVGVFNIEQRVIQPLPCGKDNPRFYSRPIWFTPTYYPFRVR